MGNRLEVSRVGYSCMYYADLLDHILIRSSYERVGLFTACAIYFGDHTAVERLLWCLLLSEGFG